MYRPRTLLITLLLYAACVAPPAAGQGRAGAATRSLDERLLRSVYEADAGLFRATMRGADVTAYYLFAAAPAAVFASAYALDRPDARPAAYRVAAAEVVALAGTFVLKQLSDRPRPYLEHADLPSRAMGLDRRVLAHDPHSFPSGHAALAFSIATSLSLSYPEWYVAGPLFLWAGAVATSRVWLGVHYPTDVLAGALLGTAAGAGVHVLRRHLPVLGGDEIEVRLGFGPGEAPWPAGW